MLELHFTFDSHWNEKELFGGKRNKCIAYLNLFLGIIEKGHCGYIESGPISKKPAYGASEKEKNSITSSWAAAGSQKDVSNSFKYSFKYKHLLLFQINS